MMSSPTTRTEAFLHGTVGEELQVLAAREQALLAQSTAAPAAAKGAGLCPFALLASLSVAWRGHLWGDKTPVIPDTSERAARNQVQRPRLSVSGCKLAFATHSSELLPPCVLSATAARPSILHWLRMYMVTDRARCRLCLALYLLCVADGPNTLLCSARLAKHTRYRAPVCLRSCTASSLDASSPSKCNTGASSAEGRGYLDSKMTDYLCCTLSKSPVVP